MSCCGLSLLSLLRGCEPSNGCELPRASGRGERVRSRSLSSSSYGRVTSEGVSGTGLGGRSAIDGVSSRRGLVDGGVEGVFDVRGSGRSRGGRGVSGGRGGVGANCSLLMMLSSWLLGMC